MTISIETEVELEWSFNYKNTAERVINAILDYFKCPFEADVSIIITDNNEIHEINLTQRQIDAATDVLSFPMNDFKIAGDFSQFVYPDTCDAFNPETGELILGDIILSYERIESQSKEYGHSIEREFGFLITHSMLHLIGFDHMEPSMAQIMEEKQRIILDMIKLYR